MDLKVPIVITDELSEEVITSTGLLDLASGDISRVTYDDPDIADGPLPFESDDYEFTSGVLSHNGRDVEFRVDVNKVTGQYAVSASELLEIKVRAAQLFAGLSGAAMLAGAGGGTAAKEAPAPAAKKAPAGRRGGRAH